MSPDAGDACVVHQDCFGGDENDDEESQRCVNQVCEQRSVGVQTSFNIESIDGSPKTTGASVVRLERRNASTSYELESTSATETFRPSIIKAKGSTKDEDSHVRCKLNATNLCVNIGLIFGLYIYFYDYSRRCVCRPERSVSGISPFCVSTGAVPMQARILPCE